MELKNKTFLVYGMGVSGLSAYNFLTEKGAEVYLYADGKNDKLQEYNVIEKFSDVMCKNFDYAVISPGVQIIGNKNLKKLKEKGVLLLSELELGYLFCKGKFIAVTGTNGKTTCVNLLKKVLSNKYKTFMCGNVGTPITSIAGQTDNESIVVCEVSSFMLELISPNFAPDIAVITNITPDHISRHKTFDAYVTAKLKITKFQTPKQYIIVNQELSNISTNANIVVSKPNKRYKTKLIGNFNQKNIEQCWNVCNLLEIPYKLFKQEVKHFFGVRFRLEYLGKKHGITYINDSKSTNPSSSVEALKAMDKKVVILLGGSDKGNDFNEIFENSNKIKLAIIYGQTANKLESDALFCGFKNTAKFENLAEALYHLKSFIKRGDIVLFSPACASYDEFKNYVERGESFNKYFKEQ